MATLNGDKISNTAEVLMHRIDERFPDSGLGRVCQNIHAVCQQTPGRIAELKRPSRALQGVSIAIVLFSLLMLLYLMMGGIEWDHESLPKSYTTFIGLLEPTLGSLVFLTAYFVFIGTLERRWKQRRVLEALNGLRSLAHVIDMHQLTKDPERLLRAGPDTASSPHRELTPFLLGRYLDYSSEMLSILSKEAALWAQAFPEPNLLTAVDQIEMLSNGLSRKIWQKVMVLESVTAHFEMKV